MPYRIACAVGCQDNQIIMGREQAIESARGHAAERGHDVTVTSIPDGDTVCFIESD